MKKLTTTLLMLLPIAHLYSQNLKPYVVGFETTESVAATATNVAAQLSQNGIKVVGQYQPANDKNLEILVFTSAELQSAIQRTGGLTGFAATLRIGITSENGKTIVSYTNPPYWGNAYFRGDFERVSSNYVTLTSHLETALKAAGHFVGRPFGSDQGIAANDLRKYHYAVSMPYFQDVVELGKFDTYANAVAKIDYEAKKGVPGVKLVSKVPVAGTNLVLYNFALSGAEGESKFLPVIDINQPKHTAFLPYEVLVDNNQAVILHGRYRIALSFPDLTMYTFTKIMSTPGNIEDSLRQLVK